MFKLKNIYIYKPYYGGKYICLVHGWLYVVDYEQWPHIHMILRMVLKLGKNTLKAT